MIFFSCLKTAFNDLNVALKLYQYCVFAIQYTTSLIKFCDQEIIHAFKTYYLDEMHTRVLEELRDKQDIKFVNKLKFTVFL